jgi:hypothetical protein
MMQQSAVFAELSKKIYEYHAIFGASKTSWPENHRAYIYYGERQTPTIYEPGKSTKFNGEYALFAMYNNVDLNSASNSFLFPMQSVMKADYCERSPLTHGSFRTVTKVYLIGLE